MGLYNDGWNRSETEGSSTSRGYSVGLGDSCLDADVEIDAESPLGRFISAHEFQAFKELLRRATREISLADFVQLRRYYDSVWSELLSEL